MAAFVLTIALVPASMAGSNGGPAPSDPMPSVWHASGQLNLVEPHVGVSGSQTDFGDAVAIDDGTAVVGAPYAEKVYVYERMGPLWQETGVLTGPEAFGSSVAIDQGTIAVAAPDASSVHVFERTGDAGWEQVAELSAEDATCLGASLALDVGLLAAADPCATDSVSVFQSSGASGWVPDARLTLDSDRLFGRSLDLSGSTLLVSGLSLRAYEKGPDGWAGPTRVSDGAGPAVALSGDIAATWWRGEVLVFERSDTHEGWAQVATLAPGDVSPFAQSERFGFALDIDDGILVVGAFSDDASPGGPDVEEVVNRQCVPAVVTSLCVPGQPGAAYVYEREAGSWGQVAKLTSEAATGADLGASVAVDADGSTILAGAPGHPNPLHGFVDPADTVHVFSRAPMVVSS